MARVVRPGDDEHLGVTHWVGRPGYIPRGRLTMASGRDGTGKTTLFCDIAARKTRGLPVLEPVTGDPLYDVPPAATPRAAAPLNLSTMRGGRDIVRRRDKQRAAQREAERRALDAGGVLIVSNEESAEDDIIPRMQTMGADEQRYLVIDDQDGPILLPRDLELIAAAAREIDAHLIVLDSILSMLASKEYHQARMDIHGLRQLARELNAAIVLINHFDRLGKMALGPSGLLTICRSRLVCERDQDFASEPYQFVLQPEKSSKGGAPRALRYETIQDRDTGIITVRWGDVAPNIGTLADMRNAQRQWLEELLLTELASGPKKFSYLCDAIKDIERSATPAQLRDARDRLQRQGLIDKWPIHQPGPHRGWWWARREHYRQPLSPNTPTHYTPTPTT